MDKESTGSGSRYSNKNSRVVDRIKTVTIDVNELSWHVFKLCAQDAGLTADQEREMLSKAFYHAALDLALEEFGCDGVGMENFELNKNTCLRRMKEKYERKLPPRDTDALLPPLE